MILTCLTALIGGSSPPASAQAECSLAALRSEASLVIRVEETRFTAQSAGREPMLLAFAREGREAELLLWLLPGARIESSFSRGAAHHVLLEVVQRSDGGWSASGALGLTPCAEGTSETLVFPSGAALEGGACATLAPAAPALTLLPERVRTFVALPSGAAGDSLPATAPEPLHVPVPQPTNRPAGDKPPKLEEKPLPPV